MSGIFFSVEPCAADGEITLASRKELKACDALATWHSPLPASTVCGSCQLSRHLPCFVLLMSGQPKNKPGC